MHCHFLAHEDTGMMATLFIGKQDWVFRLEEHIQWIVGILIGIIGTSILIMFVYISRVRKGGKDADTTLYSAVSMNELKSKVMDWRSELYMKRSNEHSFSIMVDMWRFAVYYGFFNFVRNGPCLGSCMNVYYWYVYVYNRAQLLAVRRRNYIPRISTFDTKIKQSYYFPMTYLRSFGIILLFIPCILMYQLVCHLVFNSRRYE